MKYGIQILLSITLLLAGCSENIPFTQKSIKQTFVTPGIQTYSSPIICPDPFKNDPKVDILFLIDNSVSSGYMSPEMRSSIGSLLTAIAPNFDYHAYIAPLLPSSNDGNLQNFPLVVSNRDGLPTNVVTVDIDQVNMTGWPATGGSQELGFQRAISILTANINNNIFRKGANTIVITVSNGDDTDLDYSNTTDNYNLRLNTLKKFTHQFNNGNQNANYPYSRLLSSQLRYISVVAHSNCGMGFSKGQRYMNMSRDIYNYSGATDQSHRTHKDSYNLCSNNFNSLFSDIATSMPTTVVPKVYNWWPAKITNDSNGNQSFDANAITVQKVVGNNVINIPESTSNGFSYDDQFRSNHNMREIPVVSSEHPAETSTGFHVQLHGSAKLNTPGECMIVKIQDPQSYYGYIVLPRKPKLNETIVKINGQTVPQSNTNGWAYVGFSESQNVKVQGPGDDSAALPGDYQTGHVLKMHGNAIFSNEDIVEVSYKPEAL